jgi:hypothetical protein
MTEREFTLEEARELVPWLSQVFRKLERPRARARQLDAVVKELQGKISGDGGGSSQGQLHRHRRELREASAEIEGAVSEIQERGILVKGMEPGLVDFPHQRKGRQVYLCWREGEPEIAFWHDIDTGFAGRQLL